MPPEKYPAPRSLRYRLLGLAALAIAPFVLAATLGIAEIVAERRADTQRTAAELAHALIQSVDAELRRHIAILEVLGQSRELEHDDLAAFHERARRVAAGQPFWGPVLLSRPDMRRILSTREPFPGPQEPVIDAESLRLAIESRAPVVGGVRLGPRQWRFTVRVPVVRDGQLRYVLTVRVDPEAVLAVLARQRIAPDWTVAVYDQDGRRVARSRSHAQSVGAQATPTLQRLMAGSQPEGYGSAATVEGEVVHTGFSRRSEFGWSAVVGLPDSSVREATLRQVLLHGTGLLASALLALFLVSLAARRITGPMNRLRGAAQALGRRKAAPALRSGVREIDEVASELSAAAAQLAEFEAQRAALLEAMKEALAQAEQAGRAKDEFLAVLGHELRNPLAPIVASLQVMELRGDAATAPQRAVIRRQLAQMIRLVDDLLDISRIARGRIELTKSVVDLNAVVRRAAEDAAPAAGERAPRLALRPAPQPAPVEGDEVRLVQVISNLLANAFKFTPPEGRVEVSVHRRDGRVEVEVSDTGRGIEPEFLPRIFDLFTQERPAAGGGPGVAGLGLGLAIVRNLVTLHGGEVRADSAGAGRGSRFTVSLPAAVPAPPAAPASAARPAPEPAPAPAAPRRRLLVVDDNVDAADSLALLLDLQGWEVRTAHRPGEALALLDAFPPEIAILDIGLPEMDGHELARRLRAHPAWRGGRLIALTGFGQRADRQRALEAGFDEHLTKPVAPERLMAVLAALSPAPPQAGGTDPGACPDNPPSPNAAQTGESA